MVNSAATAGKVSTACDYYGCFELVWGKSITYPMYCPKHRNSAKVAPAMCKSCLIRPVHVEQSGHAHPFCDKRCAAAYAGLPPPPPPPAVTGVQCKLDGCSKAVYTTPDGKPSDFCSIMHRKCVHLILLATDTP
ncbi:hypothetical protein BV25DRAFT_1645155 [Artomyces pyxidatus]|uniref:Uncharacterized protein n=1 Tax=Artomyces pyxidatus TaxID=48021 RepID=A0ACB8SJ52_9AGAM|nr:hypothetical protein BV25DRAFT_1645155 [Artomyces pyxidatus]